MKYTAKQLEAIKSRNEAQQSLWDLMGQYPDEEWTTLLRNVASRLDGESPSLAELDKEMKVW